MSMMAGVGAGANVVGGLMQSIAASQAQQAMLDAFKAELARQGRFRSESTGLFQQGAQEYGRENANQLMDQGMQARLQAYQPTPMSASFSPTLKDSAKLNLLGGLRAKLGSYGDWLSQLPISQMHTQQGLDRVSDKAMGQASLFPYRMQDAQHSWDELAFWGSLISSIGGSSPSWGSMFSGPPSGSTSTGNMVNQATFPGMLNQGYSPGFGPAQPYFNSTGM